MTSGGRRGRRWGIDGFFAATGRGFGGGGREEMRRKALQPIIDPRCESLRAAGSLRPSRSLLLVLGDIWPLQSIVNFGQ